MDEKRDDIFPTLVFVAHGGPLEAKSALLAASLAEYYLPGRIQARVMKPGPSEPLSSEAISLFRSLEIDCIECENQVAEDYPHGNKIAAMRGINGPAIFLDSDMLLMSPFSWHHLLSGDFAAKPADIDTFGRDGGSWAKVWEMFGLGIPPKSHRATLTDTPMRPYFNAGFIYVRRGSDFAEVWVDTARQIDRSPDIINKRPWLDQIALPVAVARLGWKSQDLPDAFNFPYHLSDDMSISPYFAHYHWPRVVARSPRLYNRVQSLVLRNPKLNDVLKLHSEWSDIQ
ncbi:hypothetical protein [Ruegeria sp. HKCCA4633]|uniref:hypothetical protein n=1 Tax=Ruegeria sp. HKCCA4633 TaxID=2682983 RepID=UPI001487AE79|nr:hypothetical protein [Ruegeria sp. HKCCA4633]